MHKAMNNLTLIKSVKDIEGLKKGLAMVKTKLESIGFPISIFSAPTTKKFTSVKYPSSSVEVSNPISVNPTEILQEVKGKYQTVCLIYDWTEIEPRPTNPAHHNMLMNNCTPIQIPIQFVSNEQGIVYPEVLCQFYLHELTHAISFLLGQPDLVHSQNSTPEWSQKPPVDYYLHLIESMKHLWDRIDYDPNLGVLKKTVTLTRRWDNGTQTLGELSVGNFSCKTLELSYRNNQRNVSCIPKGIYTAKYTFSPKFMKYTYEIQDVHNRSGIRIHSGSTFYDILGCILLGTHYTDINGDQYADIANSKVTVEKFKDTLGTLPFTLIIK